jgi:cholesterol transport system auxiliary component
MRLAFLLLAVIGMASAGCGALPRPPAPSSGTYALEVDVAAAGDAKPGDGPVLFVAPVRAQPPYQSTAMMYVERDYAPASFVTTEWVAEPARMIDPLLRRACEASGKFFLVSSGPLTGAADYQLDTELIELRQDFRASPSVGEIELRVQLTHLKERRVMAALTLAARAPAPSADPYGGVVALNAALGDVLEQVTRFLSDNLP